MGGPKQSDTPQSRRRTIPLEQVSQLSDIFKQKFGWSDGLKPFQQEALEAVARGNNVLVHSATGSGKTVILGGLHLLPATSGMVTLCASPLIALQNEQVAAMKKDFGISAVAINSSRKHSLDKILAEIVQGKYSMVFASPEMFQSRRFTDKVLRNQAFTQRVLCLAVDEAHCVSRWGDSFRKKYGSLGNIRTFLPSGTPTVAVSATLSPRVRADVISRLQFNRKKYVWIDVGNNRPNVRRLAILWPELVTSGQAWEDQSVQGHIAPDCVAFRDVSLVVRPMLHPLKTYEDLNFVIPASYGSPINIPKTLVYVDNIDIGSEIIDHFLSLLRPEHQTGGNIRPFNAIHTDPFREQAMDEFKKGNVRVLVCTDAAGMGCNVPDIDISVQWKLTKNVDSFVQRAGRSARARGTKGIGVLLVEKSACTQKGRAKLDSDMKALIEPNTCRRKALAKIYDCPKGSAQLTVPCCDVCDKTLLTRIQPHPTKPKRKRKARMRIGVAQDVVKTSLYRWREAIWREEHGHAMYSPAAILPDAIIDVLSAVGPIEAIEPLQKAVGGPNWGYWNKYGQRLLSHLQTNVKIPPFVPLPPKRKKKRIEEEDISSVPQDPTSSSAPTPPVEAQATPAPQARGEAKRRRLDLVPTTPMPFTPPATVTTSASLQSTPSHSTHPRFVLPITPALARAHTETAPDMPSTGSGRALQTSTKHPALPITPHGPEIPMAYPETPQPSAGTASWGGAAASHPASSGYSPAQPPTVSWPSPQWSTSHPYPNTQVPYAYFTSWSHLPTQGATAYGGAPMYQTPPSFPNLHYTTRSNTNHQHDSSMGSDSNTGGGAGSS